jgi:hypothetical protein
MRLYVKTRAHAAERVTHSAAAVVTVRAQAAASVHRSERRRCARCTASPCTWCASSSKSTTPAQRMLFLTTRESNRSIGLSYAMLSILCAARGESFARLAVGQTKLRHGPAPIFDFHSSMQTARRNRQTPKEFSPILHITLHCTVLRCAAPHRTAPHCAFWAPCVWVGGCGAH